MLYKLLSTILLILFASTAYSEEVSIIEVLADPIDYGTSRLWADRSHPEPKYFAVEAGSGYYYKIPDGISGLTSTDAGSVYGMLNITATKKVPLFSRLWVNTDGESSATNPVFEKGRKNPSYNRLLFEVRVPFEAKLLFNSSSIYFGYELESYTTSSRISYQTVLHGDGRVFHQGDWISHSPKHHRFTIALDTPVTSNNSPDSLSRFGFYLQQTERVRSVVHHPTSSIDNTTVDIDETHFGIFSSVRKPVFTEGFILQALFSIGFGVQQIPANSLKINTGSFQESQSLLYFGFKTAAAYRYTITENFGARIFSEFNYSSILPLRKNDSSGNIINNSERVSAQGGLSLEMLF